VQGPFSRDEVHGKGVALVEILAVRGDPIDLVRAVNAANGSAAREPIAAEVHNHYVAAAWSPLTLASHEATAYVEDQVIPGVLA